MLRIRVIFVLSLILKQLLICLPFGAIRADYALILTTWAFRRLVFPFKEKFAFGTCINHFITHQAIVVKQFQATNHSDRLRQIRFLCEILALVFRSYHISESCRTRLTTVVLRPTLGGILS